MDRQLLITALRLASSLNRMAILSDGYVVSLGAYAVYRADVGYDGDPILADAKQLLSVLGRLDDAEVDIGADGQIGTGRRSYRIPVAETEHVAAPDDDIETEQLAGLLGKIMSVKHAMSRDRSREALQQVIIERSTDGDLVAFATDGCRISIDGVPGDRGERVTAITSDALALLSRMSPDVLCFGDSWVDGAHRVYVRQMLAQYPPWRSVISFDTHSSVTVDRDSLIQAIGDVMAIGPAAVLSVTDGELRLAHESTAGDAKVAIGAIESSSTATEKRGVNLQFMADAVGASEPSDDGALTIDFAAGDLGQMVIDGGGHYEMLMPMRL